MTSFDDRLNDHRIHRRALLTRILQWVGASAVLTALSITRAVSDEKGREIKQPIKTDKKHFMTRAFEMKRIAIESGDQGYGAIIVKNGLIVGEGPSRVYVNHDPTAHGEMEAIRDAGRRLGTKNLSECDIYTTARPCPMCETACYWANLSRIYYGADIVDAGGPRYSSC